MEQLELNSSYSPGADLPQFPQDAERRDMESLCRTYGASTFFRRWVATILDTFVLASLGGLPFMVTSRLGEHAGYFTLLIFIAGVLAYYLLLEGYSGFTLGKFALRIRVVNEEGKPPRFVKSLARTMLRIVDVNPFLFGGLPAGICVLVTPKKQRLGDMAAQTYVVKTRDLDPVSPRANTVLIVSFAVLLLAAICSAVLGLRALVQESGKPNFFYSKDDRFQISASSGWREDTDLNDHVNIAISNRYADKYVMVLSEPLDTLEEDMTLEDYEDEVSKQIMGSLEDARWINRPYKTIINGYDAYQCEVQGNYEGESVSYLITAVETSNHFSQIHAWAPTSKYRRTRTELLNIIFSYKETDSADLTKEQGETLL